MVRPRLRVRRDKMIRWGAWFVLLTAVLPNVMYVGHWPGTADAHTEAPEPPVRAVEEHSMRGGWGTHTHHAGQARPETPPDSPREPADDEHSLHCHTGPAKCSGPQATIGSLSITEDSALLAFDAQLRELPSIAQSPKAEPIGSRILQPPRFVA
jgi:hypothetical protein